MLGELEKAIKNHICRDEFRSFDIYKTLKNVEERYFFLLTNEENKFKGETNHVRSEIQTGNRFFPLKTTSFARFFRFYTTTERKNDGRVNLVQSLKWSDLFRRVSHEKMKKGKHNFIPGKSR